MDSAWRQGRGRLGVLDPLIGAWIAEGSSEQGGYHCERRFTRTLGDAYVQLDATWTFGAYGYEERALFGTDHDGAIRFWSFTSDQKQSHGWLAEWSGLPTGAFAFEADMPAGRARMAYWPDVDQGFRYVVESQGEQGWDRFLEHHYVAAPV